MKHYFLFLSLLISALNIEAIVYTSVTLRNQTDSQIKVDMKYSEPLICYDDSRTLQPMESLPKIPTGICWLKELKLYAKGGMADGKTFHYTKQIKAVDSIIFVVNEPSGQLGIKVMNAFNNTYMD